MDYLSSFKDNEFDLAIVDPPYGIKESAHRNKSRTKLAKTQMYKKETWDMKIPTIEYFSELIRVSKNQIIWGINYYTHVMNFSPGRIVWHKDNGNNNFSDCELAYQSFTKAIRYVKYRWAGMLQHDMKNKEIRVHPTQKPIQLYKWLLKRYAKEGDIILDTHLGSGSSAIAAHIEGFDFTGIEIDHDYYKAAKKRFKEVTSQTRMFQ